MSVSGIDTPSVSSSLLTPATSNADTSRENLRATLDGVPELHTFVATEENDKVEALKLVADGVAQQRQSASRALLQHPVNLFAFGILLATIGQIIYKIPGDWAKLMTTTVGLAMASLVVVRWMVSPYIPIAERVNWEWLDNDIILATKYGNRIIGALVLHMAESDRRSGRRRKSGGRGIVRAWTVLLKYRGKGEGRALLQEAVKTVQKNAGHGLDFEEGNICEFDLVNTDLARD